MAKTRNRKKTPRSSIPMEKIAAVPLPKRGRRRPTISRPPAELPEPVATFEI